MVLKDLMQNMLVLIVLSYFYSLLYRYKDTFSKLLYILVSGLLFGVMAILVIMSPFLMTPGVLIDGRSIVLGIAGLFGGFQVAIPAVVISGLYRIIIGGSGVWAGLGIITSSALTGIIFKLLIRSGRLKSNLTTNYLFGLLLHIEMILWMFVLPVPLSTEVLNLITIPVLTMFPIVTIVVIKMLTDQEKRIEMSKLLSKNEERRLTAEKIAKIGIWEMNEETGEFFVTANLLKILKIQSYNSLKKLSDLREYITEEYQRYVENVYNESREYKRPYNIEFAMERSDGSIIYVNEICTIEYDENENPLRIIGTFQDITLRKESELKLRHSEEGYKNLYNSIHDAIMVIDQALKIINVNPACVDLFRYDKAEMINMNISDVLFEMSSEKEFKAMIENNKCDNRYNLIFRYKRRNNTLFQGETKMSFLYTEAGESQYIIIIRDVTHQQRINEQLRDYQENLEEKISLRTGELQKANEELTGMISSFHGREFRIKELRVENKALKKLLLVNGIDYSTSHKGIREKE